MAKKVAGQPRKKSEDLRPEYLEMKLFAAGMTPLHRAGLGGLAATLRFIEQSWRAGTLAADSVPGHPWRDNQPPWTIAPEYVNLRFGTPEGATDFFRRLFEVAFQTQDGVIRLPGQYRRVEPPLPVLVELQNALTLTFLQHGKTRVLAKKEAVLTYKPEGEPTGNLTLAYKACLSFKHQGLWQQFVDALARTRSR